MAPCVSTDAQSVSVAAQRRRRRLLAVPQNLLECVARELFVGDTSSSQHENVAECGSISSRCSRIPHRYNPYGRTGGIHHISSVAWSAAPIDNAEPACSSGIDLAAENTHGENSSTDVVWVSQRNQRRHVHIAEGTLSVALLNLPSGMTFDQSDSSDMDNDSVWRAERSQRRCDHCLESGLHETQRRLLSKSLRDCSDDEQIARVSKHSKRRCMHLSQNVLEKISIHVHADDLQSHVEYEL